MIISEFRFWSNSGTQCWCVLHRDVPVVRALWA